MKYLNDGSFSSEPSNEAYRKGWDRTFSKQKQKRNIKKEEGLCELCDKPASVFVPDGDNKGSFFCEECVKKYYDD